MISYVDFYHFIYLLGHILYSICDVDPGQKIKKNWVTLDQLGSNLSMKLVMSPTKARRET